MRDAIVRAETILRDTEDRLPPGAPLRRRRSARARKIAENAAYINQANARIKSYEIAGAVGEILTLTRELMGDN